MKTLNLKFIILVVISLINLKSNGQDYNKKAKKLNSFYSQAINTNKTNKKFFYEFPSTFKELIYYYGETDDFVGILSSRAYEHIDLFFELGKTLPKAVFYSKCIQISIDGKFEVDGVAHFQMLITRTTNSDLPYFFHLLSKINDKSAFKFWYFYFDGPHLQDSILIKFSEMKKIYPKQYQILIDAFNEVKKSNFDH